MDALRLLTQIPQLYFQGSEIWKFAGQNSALHTNCGFNPNKKDSDLISSGCPGRSVLLIAVAAVNRPGSIRLEGNLGLLAAFGAGYICHFSGTAVVASSGATAVFVFSLKHLYSLTLLSIQGTDYATKDISTNLFESTQNVTDPSRGSLPIYLLVKKNSCGPAIGKA